MADFTHVYDAPPSGANPDWTIPQSWEAFSADEHAMWDRLFARQSAMLPGRACDAFVQGMAALPALLRSRMAARVHLDTRVDHLARQGTGWVAQTAGGSFTGAAVVVATDPVTASALTGLPAPRMRGLATWWFSAPQAPIESRCLQVDGSRRGPVVNTAVISNVQPAYAPAGRHLVQASTLLVGAAPSEADVRVHLEQLYACSTTDWTVVATHLIPQALPAIEPGGCLLYTSPSPRDGLLSRMPSSA